MTVLSLRFRRAGPGCRRVAAAPRWPNASRQQEATVQRPGVRHDRHPQPASPERGVEEGVAGGAQRAACQVRRAAHYIGDTAHRILYAVDPIRVAAHPIPVAAHRVCAAAYDKRDAAPHTAAAARHLLVTACHKTKATHRIRVSVRRTPAATRRSTRHQTPPPTCGGRYALPHLPHSALDCPPRAGVSPPSIGNGSPSLKFVRRPKNHGRDHLWEPSLVRKLSLYRAAIAPIPAKRRQIESLSAAVDHQRDERSRELATVVEIVVRRAKRVTRRHHLRATQVSHPRKMKSCGASRSLTQPLTHL